MSVSATQEITNNFTAVSRFSQWKKLYEKYKAWKPEITKSQWFIKTIFSLPTWENFHTFTTAIEVIIKDNKSLSQSDWFNDEIFERFKPDVEAADAKAPYEIEKQAFFLTEEEIKENEEGNSKKISKCKCCQKEIYWWKTKNNKNIPVDTKLQVKTEHNMEALVINIDSEIGKIKDLGSGYFIHFYTCPVIDNLNKSFDRAKSNVINIKRFIPVLDEDKIPI